MLFYSHCNLLAHCFLRSQRSKNKQSRGSLTEPNRKIFQRLRPPSPHHGPALVPLGAHSAPPTPSYIGPAFGVLQRSSAFAVKTSGNFSVFFIKSGTSVQVKCRSCYILLLIGQISLSGCLYFLRSLAKCVFVSQVVTEIETKI